MLFGIINERNRKTLLQLCELNVTPRKRTAHVISQNKTLLSDHYF